MALALIVCLVASLNSLIVADERDAAYCAEKNANLEFRPLGL